LVRIRIGALLGHLGLGLVMIAAITFLCGRIFSVNATTAGFAYLLGVLAIATAWGLIEAVVASVVAMLCFNFYFLPPIGQFTISDPQNWVALFAFLATALIASHVSDREKKQALEAKARQKETEQLYALSRIILLTDPTQSIGFQSAQHIAEIFDCPAVALYDAKSGDIFRGGAEDLPDVEAKLKQVVMQSGSLENSSANYIVAPIILGGQPIGALALKSLSLSDGALRALLNLVAIAIERVRTEETASRAEAARQSEEFKSTLLDAIAHEFKTPLTSIKAASTSMLSDSAGLSPQFRELATIIDEETDRMNLLVTEAVRMSQIDAGKVRLEREPLDVGDLLRRVLKHFESSAEGRELNVQVDASLPAVSADKDLVSLALRQLIDNALKYSPPGSPIGITAGLQDHRVIIRVKDRGPGIPERERERIFDKFYRRQMTKSHVPGTGLGLYIAREIARAHGGDVWVEGAPGSGSEFCFALPIQERERQERERQERERQERDK
jgi:two-component system, OmpR family, sensor histidine kinase KdpD